MQRLKEQKIQNLAPRFSSDIDILQTHVTGGTPLDLHVGLHEMPVQGSTGLNGTHFPVATPQGPTLRYFGGSSVFSLAVATMARVRSDSKHSLPPLQHSSTMEVASVDFHGSCNCTITRRMVEKSVELYMASIHPIYPFLAAEAIHADLEAYWEIQRNGTDPALLKGEDAHRFFRIKIIAAIASASRSRHNASRIACDHGCYLEVIKCIAEVTSEASTDSLRALMLLIVYCLFRPRKGDIWKLLDYACRLSLELGYHTEPDSSVSDAVREQQRNTFWSLYTLERIIGQLFGRPSDLPETIITTELPKATLTWTQDDNLGMDTIKARQAVHHTRLVYLRSGFFHDIYLSDHTNGNHDLMWYQERVATIVDWYQQSRDDMAIESVCSLTCSVAFHSTLLFLFQPLVVSSLNETRRSKSEHESTAAAPLFIPAEVYTSACKLIEDYEAILRAPRESTMGTYPLTFMSAHYIYMASMMIMAHCVLYLDGRVSFPHLIGDATVSYTSETAHMRLENVLQVSNSCLVLLTFCAEKWPGMAGMRDTFKQLSDQLVKQILQSNLT